MISHHPYEDHSITNPHVENSFTVSNKGNPSIVCHSYPSRCYSFAFVTKTTKCLKFYQVDSKKTCSFRETLIKLETDACAQKQSK